MITTSFYLMVPTFFERKRMPKWKKVNVGAKKIESILTRFEQKLLPLKKQLDEEVARLNKELQEKANVDRGEAAQGSPGTEVRPVDDQG